MAEGQGWRGDPEAHAEAGRKGGLKTAQNRERMRKIGRMGGLAVAARPGHMSEIARKGAAATNRKRKSAKKSREC
jgi:general stress protein YciG